MKIQEYEIEKGGQLRIIFSKHKQLLFEFNKTQQQKEK